jgi:YD repeat-containing protein
MTDGSGRVLFYGYDHGGRLISVADEAGEIVGYRHTPGGKVKEIRHRNGVRTAYEYDTEGNIIRLLTETRDGGTICDLRYEYDLNGNRTAKSGTMLLPGHPGGVFEQIRDIRYRYDRMDRLTAEVRDREETSYLSTYAGTVWRKGKGGGLRDTVIMGKTNWSDGWQAEMLGTIPMTSRVTWSGKLDQRGRASIFMIPKTVRSVSFPVGRRFRRIDMTGKGCVPV